MLLESYPVMDRGLELSKLKVVRLHQDSPEVRDDHQDHWGVAYNSVHEDRLSPGTSVRPSEVPRWHVRSGPWCGLGSVHERIQIPQRKVLPFLLCGVETPNPIL